MSSVCALHTSTVAATPSAINRQVLVVLCGAQGSGKSTFCENLRQGAKLRWHRVNQDTIKRDDLLPAELQGKSGTRCGVEPSQRDDFVVCAQSHGCQAHALVLLLPADLCAQRAAGRELHEGGLTGGRAGGFSKQASTALRKNLPSLDEGFSSIAVCRNDRDVSAALEAWKGYDGQGPTPDILPMVQPQTMTAFFQPISKPPAPQACPTGPPRPPAGSPTDPALLSAPGPPASEPPAPEPSGSLPPAAASPASPLVSAPCTVPSAEPPAGTPGLSAAGQQSLVSPAPRKRARTVGPDVGPGSTASHALPAASSGAVLEPVQPQQAVSPSGRNAFASLMSAARTKQKSEAGAKPAVKAAPKAGNPWSMALQTIAKAPPAEGQNVIVRPDCVLILDKYPKFRLHALVIARDLSLGTPIDLTAAQLPLLQHMKDVGLEWLQRHGMGPGGEFKMGFHRIPSMHQLHLHVISQDVAGSGMKDRKKHWNTFTTPYFITLAAVRAALQADGHLHIDVEQAKQYLEAPLACHRCAVACRTMPELLAHIAGCSVAVPV